MTLFQIILFAASAFFAWQIFKFVQSLGDGETKLPSHSDAPPPSEPERPAYPGTQEIDTLIDKADSAYGDGNLAEARVYLERAEKQDPDSPEVLNKLGFILFKEGAHEEALQKYNRSLTLDPGDDLTHNAVAGVLRKLGRLDEAQEHYKSAVDIDDAFEETYYNYGRLLIEKGDMEGARMMFEKALELRPGYPEAAEALERLK
ncbi:tetratricopeptide repeat protein [Sulfurimonas diazotrophicus]|uniref:Tetratricopeptide repeat protein n=1 Tax=Sulfurimonas diazotrophicus TaxID=3131939 RepID=A0ABZ3HB74_9BACT